MKNILITIVVIALAGAGAYIWYNAQSPAEIDLDVTDEQPTETIVDPDEEITEPEEDEQDVTLEEPDTERPEREVLGQSVSGNDIVAYNLGTGDETVLFVGGMHGGYSYNTALLGYELVDHLRSNPNLIPENITVTVIPTLNVDGIERATGDTGRFTSTDVTTNEAEQAASRFNANNVDLNRNFDCNWSPEGTWSDQTVSGGASVFSEPEAQAVRAFVQDHSPVAVVAWYAAAGEVFASSCGDAPVMEETQQLMELYAAQSGYTAQQEFTYYPITGDMTDWLAQQQIPAISVLLTDRVNTEWNRNRTAIEALLRELAS